VSQLRVSPRASADLIEIWSYIADDSVANADAFIDNLTVQKRWEHERR
jgi:plasmid stabilization system protein ParE